MPSIAIEEVATSRRIGCINAVEAPPGRYSPLRQPVQSRAIGVAKRKVCGAVRDRLCREAPVLAHPVPLALGSAAASAMDGFDEREYLRCNPDVRQAIMRGQMASGAAHYQTFGMREGRRLSC